MDDLTENALASFFEKLNTVYINPMGMQIGRTEDDDIWTYLTHQTYAQGPWEVSIATEDYSPSCFASGFQLKSIQDIDRLNYTSSWMRYLNGQAEIIIKPIELDFSVTFKIHRYKTLIFSLEKHFYDEAYRHLTMPDDFEDYFLQKEPLLDKINGRKL